MFVDVLPPRGLEVLDLLSKALPMEEFYLAGGTGLALQLGHRESYDLDFFSRREFDTFSIIQALGATGRFDLTGEADWHSARHAERHQGDIPPLSV